MMRRRAIPALALLLAALGLVVAGCGGAAEATGGGVPESASLAPADALAYATVTTDESSGQWSQAVDLLDRFPGANEDLQKQIATALEAEGATWKDDVAPALGPEVVLVVTSDRKTIVLTQPDDEDKLAALVAKSDETVVSATVDGWTALAEDQSDLTSYEASLAQGTLAGADGLDEGFASLPAEALVRGWVDVAALTPDLREELGQAGQDLDIGVDWLAAGFAAEDDGLRLAVGVRTPGGDGTEYEPKLPERVPADAVVALSFGGTQKLVDQLERRIPLDQIAGFDVAAVLDLFVGEHGAERRAPVDRHLGDVGEVFLHQAQEDPLGPAVILGIGGRDLALPVVGKAEPLDLAAEVVDVAFGDDRRRDAFAHRRPFGG